jgi:RecA/RadA recombinase
MPVLASLLKMDDDTIVLGVPDGNGGFIDSETGREVVVASVAGELSKIQYCDCYSKALFVPKPLPGNGDNEFEKDAIFQARLEGYSTNSYEDVTVHYVNIEGDLDVGWARKIGIDTSRMAVTVCETGEEAVDVVKFLIDSCDNDVIIVDSLAMMVPMTEVEESAHDAHMGLQSRMLNQAMRVWTQARVAAKRKHGRDITILLVNQWRMKIDRFGGGPQLVGGLGQRFVGSFQVKCWSKKGESSQIDVGKKGYEVDVAETATTCFKVEKNKTFGSKEVEGEIEFFVRDCEEGKAGEVREFDYIWTLAKYFGIVFKQEKPIKWIMNGKVFDTETAAKAAVRTDPEVMAGLRSTLMTLLLGQIKKEMLGGKR